MRAVLDTNVLVSAALTKGGTCDRILRLMAIRRFEACVDARMLAEYADVLGDPELPAEPRQVKVVLDTVELAAIHVEAPCLAARLPHEDDRPFLEVAAAAEAVLVTGNQRHFPAKACKDVRVVSPAEFLELLSHEGERGA